MKIIMLLDNAFSHDPRVQREAFTLKDAGHRIMVFCCQANGLPNEDSLNGIEIRRVFTQDAFDIKKPVYLQKMAEHIAQEEIQDATEKIVLHCHDQTMLHVGTLIKKKYHDTTLIYDSHELFHSWPLNLTTYNKIGLYVKSYLVRKWQIIREFRNAKYIDHLITVNDSIANILQKHFRLSIAPVVVRNISDYQTIDKKPSLIKQKFNIPEDHTLVVFISGKLSIKNQNLQQVMDQLGNKEKVTLVIIAGDNPEKRHHQAYVQKQAFQNILFHDKIAPSSIVDYLSACDVGLLPFWNKLHLSYWYALPNKLFEYIMAEIPILSTQQPEYKNIIDTYEVGVCVNPDQANAFSEGLDELIGKLPLYPEKLTKAKKILNWENEKNKLVELYTTIAAKN